MTRRSRVPTPFALLLACAALAGCASTAANGRGQPMQVPQRFMVTYREEAPYSRDTIPLPVDRAWAVLPAVFQELGLPGARAANVQERVMITPHVRIRGELFTGNRNSSFLDCGTTIAGVPRADTHSVTFMVMTRMRPLPGGGTVIETMLDGTAREHVSANTPAECSGTGRLERHIVTLVRQKAASGG